MNEREYIRLKRQAHEEYKRKLEALEVVWQMANGCAPPSGKQKPKPTAEAGSAGAASVGRIVELVTRAVAAMGQTFTTKDVDRWIAQNAGPAGAERSTISHTLKRLQTVKLIEAGKGKRPSVYEKVQVEPQTSTTEQQDEIRRYAKELQLDAAEFRREVLNARYNVEKIAQLTVGQAEEVLSELRQRSWKRRLEGSDNGDNG